MKKALACMCCAALILSMSAGSVSAFAAENDFEKSSTTVTLNGSKDTAKFSVDGFTFQINDYSNAQSAYIVGFDEDWYSSEVRPEYKTDHKLLLPKDVTYKGKAWTVTEVRLNGYADHAAQSDTWTFEYVVIPREVHDINQSFAKVKSLKEVTFEDGSKLDRLKAAFHGCTNLERVGIGTTAKLPDGITHIEESCFSGCTKLKSIILPSNLNEIGDYGALIEEDGAFYKCESLKDIHIPATVRCIRIYSFTGCSNLETVVFETYQDGENRGKSELYSLDWSAATSQTKGVFEDCIKLENVELPNSIEEYDIPKDCFKNTNLKGINIPESVKKVEAGAFANTKLSENAYIIPEGESKGKHYGIAFFNPYMSTIDDDAFGDNNSSSIIIAGYKGSEANMFVKRKNKDIAFEFVSLGDWNYYKLADNEDFDSDSDSDTPQPTPPTDSDSDKPKPITPKDSDSDKPKPITPKDSDSSKTTPSKPTSSITSNTSSKNNSSSNGTTSPKTGNVTSFLGTAFLMMSSAAAMMFFGKRKDNE